MDENQNLWPCPHKAAKDKIAVKYQGWAATNTQTGTQIQNMETQTGKQRWTNARLPPPPPNPKEANCQVKGNKGKRPPKLAKRQAKRGILYTKGADTAS